MTETAGKNGEVEESSESKKDSRDGVRVGVYVCHCGLNIAGSVDCEGVAEYAEKLDDVVVSKHNRYTCSEPGQEEIKKDIKEHNLNKVVIASCTPRLHEPTFRATCEAAGLNKYNFEMANIREHCSWVHLHDRKEATDKAKDLVKMAVAKARLLESQYEAEVPVIRRTLVMGAGVAGIQAALDLADAGYKVYLVEKEPSIGGKMAQIDKTFPTMDCSICILAPKMAEAGRHPNIELLTNSEVKNITGYIGNFHVTVDKKPRYVTSDCTACGDCSDVCPVAKPNEFDIGLALRKAIYTPFAQAVPSVYIIDMENCLGYQPIACGKCKEACEANAINFDQVPEELHMDVGTVIVATGVDTYDPTILDDYGYTSYENVITSLEFERLINAGGPSGGKLIRPSDGQIPKKVGFIQCIGSRSQKQGNPYCSNVCCMNTIKDSLLIKEHWPETEIEVFYIDIRAVGKEGGGNSNGQDDRAGVRHDHPQHRYRAQVRQRCRAEAAHPVPDQRRILYGSPSKIKASGCPHTGRVHLRLCRGSKGYQGQRDPGKCRGVQGQYTHGQGQGNCGGHHLKNQSRVLHGMWQVRQGMPLPCN
jgi:heterodisulfide reductase subunit A